MISVDPYQDVEKARQRYRKVKDQVKVENKEPGLSLTLASTSVFLRSCGLAEGLFDLPAGND